MNNTHENDNPLETLKVIDRIDVGPVLLERRRMVVPYRVIRDGVDDTTQLIYRYEEDVFNPTEPGSINLSNMIAAQVALNYGLFCDEIVFHCTPDLFKPAVPQLPCRHLHGYLCQAPFEHRF